MVGVGGYVAGGCALHFAGGVREAVPDGFDLAVFGPGAFDLIGGGGGAPNKFFGKLEGRETRLRLEQFADEAMARRQDGKRSGGSKSGGEKIKAVEIFSSAHRLPPPLRGFGTPVGGFTAAAK